MRDPSIFVSLTVLSLLLISGASLVFVPTFANSSVTSGTSPSFNQIASGKISNAGRVELTATTYVPPDSNLQSRANASAPNKAAYVISRERPSTTVIAAASTIPKVSVDRIANNSGAATTAKGVNSYENQVVNGVAFEPPDQGLCAGNGYVVDAVNTEMQIYTTSFARISGVFSPNTVDGLSIAAFTSDPRCIFDQATGHWFLIQLYIDSTGAGQGFVYIAVSATSVPWGKWYVYALNVTDSFPVHAASIYKGQSSDPACPCFGDQPLLGASRDALVISTNEFPIAAIPGFNGAQVYFIDKLGLAQGMDAVSYVHLNSLGIATPDGGCLASGSVDCWYSVNPAASPTPGQFDSSAGGTEYALSSLDFQLTGDNRLAAWSFTNTKSLASTDPDVSFAVSLAKGVDRYTDPLDANGNGLLVPQKAGPIPLGNTMYSHHPHSPVFGCVAKCKEGLIQTNGDGMFDTVVYAQSALWGGVNTEVLETLGGKTSVHAGVLYWVVNAMNGAFSFASQGYVAARGEDVLYPSIGVGPTGNGILTFTLTGKDYYPSSAYAVVNKASAGALDKRIFVADLGMSPYDALTEYQCIAGTCLAGSNYVPRWGDYTWAVWADGKVYFSTEYIPYPNCGNVAFKADSSCDHTRGLLANWGTSLNSIAP